MTPIPDGELSEEAIRAILDGCEGVTPGPWTWGAKYLCHYRGRGDYQLLAQAPSDDYDSKRWNVDAAHIARLSPEVVTKLCNLALAALRQHSSGAKPVARASLPQMVCVPDRDHDEARIVGFRIREGDEAWGDLGLSEPLFWLERLISPALAHPVAVPSEEAVRVALRHLVASSRAFLRYFDPLNLAEDKSQQWQSVEHDIGKALAALRQHSNAPSPPLPRTAARSHDGHERTG